MLKKRLVIFFLVLVFFSLSALVYAGQGTGSGKQFRGDPIRGAKLEGKTFVVPSGGATIKSVTCNGKGFWIADAKKSGFVIAGFDKNNEAVGYLIPAGTYNVYPNLYEGQEIATVTITYVW